MLHHSSLTRIPRPKRTTRLHKRLAPNANDHDNNLDASSNPEKYSDNSSTSNSYQPSHSSGYDESIPSSLKLKVFSYKRILFSNKSNPKITHNHLRLTFTNSIYKQTIAHFSLSRQCSRKSIQTSSPSNQLHETIHIKTKTYN